jgi:hypothetical protein
LDRPLGDPEICITIFSCGDPPIGETHGIRDADIRHAAEHPIVVVDLDDDSDPPKVLTIGPDRAGNMLEVIALELADDELLAIHAMPLRPAFHALLPHGGDSDG